MKFDPLRYKYPSRRTLVYASRGMVATTQPLAAQAGVEAMRRGGNAVDAAVATAAALSVTEPVSNGIGGDAFAIVWSSGRLHGLNSSGWAPALTDAEKIRARYGGSMPLYGWETVTVPGAPAAWAALSAKFGRLPLTETIGPAIECAENGFPVSPTAALLWKRRIALMKKELRGEEFSHLFESFTNDGEAPKAGEIWRCRDQARTLEKIAATDAEAFYRGELAERIDKFSRESGGALRADDLAAYAPEWIEPISVNYNGCDVWEMPPNGQGITALMALNVLKRLRLGERDCTRSYHLQIEALKLAFAESLAEVADCRFMRKKLSEMLSEEFAARQAARIDEKSAGLFTSEGGASGGTVYLATADGEGNMVSMIQSNYIGFGSGLCVPGTGIALHGRGNNFSLDADHPNCIAPHKKPYHTIIPGFITKGGRAVGPFGVMGAFMQPQGHVQLIANMTDFALNPQEALDAPRFQWLSGKKVALEQGVPNHILNELADMGHEVRVDADGTSYGRGQAIIRSESGALAGATEPRADGYVAVF